ncbi:unnamed protein product [Cladocopium goreaui]|uniref:Uncharacterized protein n=1 Tax=Cladocopium goreaui TaxID=2562237 RepID=A0A9P1CLA5_9DINO|nr:unnamed protein product [Cladocopium goreaui]
MPLMSSTVYSPVPTNCPQERSNSKDSEGSKMGDPYPPRRTMLVASDERQYSTSSWLSKVEGFPCGASIKETYHGICIVISIFSDMPSRHMMHFLFVFISYMLVVLTGAVQMQLVDTSFFRAVGLLLAVLLSLRAKNAVSRRQKLMAGVLDMMNCAKNLLYLVHFNPNSRAKLRGVLEFAFLEAAAWALPVMEQGEDVADLNDLPEEYREVAFVLRAKYAAHISPRPLFMWLRELCDELFDPALATKSAGISIIRRFHRNAEEELHTLFAKFDFLLMFRENFVTDQFRWMLETVIFIYVVLYPWCVCTESNLVLGATTVGMACVFYGLNSLTEQLEDPVHHPQGVDLKKTFKRLFEELDRDDKMREYSRAWLNDAKKTGARATEDLHGKFEENFQVPKRGQVYADMV